MMQVPTKVGMPKGATTGALPRDVFVMTQVPFGDAKGGDNLDGNWATTGALPLGVFVTAQVPTKVGMPKMLHSQKSFTISRR
jgi:hypothetical protein